LSTTSDPAPSSGALAPRRLSRVAAGVDGYSEGRDAAALGGALARAAGAELMLISVHTDPLVVLPPGMNWHGLEQQSISMLREVRDALAPDARIVVETDLSVARALWRVVRRENRDLLVVGSSRLGPAGHVRIGKRTRQLLCGFECPLAVAPRGLHERGEFAVRRIGVGYDGGPEARAAAALASGLAQACGAELHLWAVVDDRIRMLGWSKIGTGSAIAPQVGSEAAAGAGSEASAWDNAVSRTEELLRAELEAAAAEVGAGIVTVCEVVRGRPADALLQLSGTVDLIVIGSRRWGLVARVVLGSTGEALLRDAASPVLVVPRPTDPGEEDRAGAT
jgi:nucleotide-binding universal stress UspA family protein